MDAFESWLERRSFWQQAVLVGIVPLLVAGVMSYTVVYFLGGPVARCALTNLASREGFGVCYETAINARPLSSARNRGA